MYNISIATIVWITGASSGIGAALARSVPLPNAKVVGISRRRSEDGDHLPLDLTKRQSWYELADHFSTALRSGDYDAAIVLHFAGEGFPHGPAADADFDEYVDSVILNSVTGQVLGKAFVGACRGTGVAGTLVLCSSPAAATPFFGISHYGAGKSAIEYWIKTVAQEESQRAGCHVFGIIPWAIDTPMLRAAIAQSPDEVPLVAMLRVGVEAGQVSTPDEAAAEVWAAVVKGVAPGSLVHVGTPPKDETPFQPASA